MNHIRIFPGISNGARLLLLICLIILGTALSVSVAYLISILILGKDILLNSDIMLNIHFVRIMQILNQIGIFIIPPFILALFTETNARKYLGFNSFKGTHLLATLSLIIFMSPIVSLLMEFNEGMRLPDAFNTLEEWMRNSEDKATELVNWMLSYTDPSSLMINLLMIVLLPALGEELLFRAALIRIFKGIFRNIHIAVWISAILFSAFHMQFYGFLPRMFLGLVFGYLFIWSGSIWIPVIAHFINNGTVVVITLLNSNNIITQSPEEFGKVNSPYLISISLIFTALVCYYLIKTKESNKLFPIEANNESTESD